MCGLVGVFGDISVRMEGLFEDLLILDVIRGPHSTGVAILKDEDKTPKVIKGVVYPNVLLESRDYQKATDGIVNLLMMGHNRFATRGKVTKKNAHPFKRGDITLCHNGTLWSTYTLGIKQKFETDSETLTESISTNGIADTWENVDGAATLTWWDRKDKSFNVITNGKRPFHFGRTADKKTLIWASENWMLRGACSRKNIKFDQDKTFYMPNETLYTFRQNKDGIIVHKVKKLEKFTWVGRVFNNSTPHNYSHYGSGLTKKEKEQLENAKRMREGDNLLPFFNKNRRHHQIPLSEDKNLAKNQMTLAKFRGRYDNCAFCEDFLIDPAQYEAAFVIDDYNVVCGSCVMVAELNNIKISKELLLK